jgi:hypothetical protein
VPLETLDGKASNFDFKTGDIQMKRIKILALAIMLGLVGAIHAASYAQDKSNTHDAHQASMSCCADGADCCHAAGECCKDGAECCKAKADGSHADCCKADASSCDAKMAEGDCCKAAGHGKKHEGNHAAQESCEMSKDGKGCCNGGACCKAKTEKSKGV